MVKPVIVEPELEEDEAEPQEGDGSGAKLGDGDDGDDGELEIEVEPEEQRSIYKPPTLDECRRAFVFDRLSATEYLTIEFCEEANEWLKSGALPKKPRSHLKTVKD